MTRRTIVSLLTFLLLGRLAPVGAAQQEADDTLLPAVELSVNLERLKRKLAALPATDEERSILKLSFYVEVYGRSPGLNLLQGFDLHTGPVPFGGATHADMRDLWTPQEFSTPAAVSVPLGWIFKR